MIYQPQPHRGRWKILLFAAFVVFSAAVRAQAADRWTMVRTRNFTLIGNASEKDIRTAGNRLEQFRAVFGLLLPDLKLTSATPTRVIVFKSDAAYHPYKVGSNIAGYFQPGDDVNYITLTTERTGGHHPYRTVFHEYVHLLLRNTMGSTIPVWFDEGLAEYYSTFEISDNNRKVTLGNPLQNHVQYLRESTYLPLRTLFTVDRKSSYYNESRQMNMFYAESWMLTHYLLQGDKQERRAQLTRFVELLRSGTKIETAFQESFQLDLDTFESSFKAYIQNGLYQARKFAFQKQLDFDSEMQSELLSEAEAKAYLGDLLQHTRRYTEAEAHLQEALKLAPGLPLAEASLGMLRVRQGKLAEAREHLKKAAEANTQNYLTHYYYAFAISGLSLDGLTFISTYAPEDAALMRSELKKAIALKPDFPESYTLLGLVNVVTNVQIDETIELLKRALTLSRGQRMVFILAQLYVRKENFNGVRELLEPIALNSPDPEMRQRAQSLLTGVQRAEEQLASLRGTEASGVTASIAAAGETTLTIDWDLLLSEALRKPKPGETRLHGVLTTIECNAKGIVFHVKSGERLIKFHRENFKRMAIAAFTQDVGREITCGPRQPENAVVLTYVSTKDKSNGEIVALEFVPKDFVLKP